MMRGLLFLLFSGLVLVCCNNSSDDKSSESNFSKEIILDLDEESFSNGFSPGSGLGSLSTLTHNSFNNRYLMKYGDTLLENFPEYKIPDSLNHIDVGYAFLNLKPFYFENEPREILYIQWEGTGFIEVRMAYDLRTNEVIQENHKLGLEVSDSVKKRIELRFSKEILPKIDSLIENSPERDSAIYLPPLERTETYYQY